MIKEKVLYSLGDITIVPSAVSKIRHRSECKDWSYCAAWHCLLLIKNCIIRPDLGKVNISFQKMTVWF